MDQKEKKIKQNPAALLPILVFLALYLGTVSYTHLTLPTICSV